MNRVVVVLAVLSLSSASAIAGSKRKGGGALSQVVGGLRSKQAPAKHRTPSRPRNDDSDDSDFDSDDDDGHSDIDWQPAANLALSSVFVGVRPPSGKTDVDMHTSLMMVKNSDFAVGSMLRTSYRTFSLSAAYTAYVEELPMDDTLTFTTWRINGGYRWTLPGYGEVTVDAGPTGGHSRGLNLIGVVAGATARLAVFNAFGVDAATRGYAYKDGSSALEWEAGARLSVIRVGYRWTKFDVGPALEGTEIGIALSF